MGAAKYKVIAIFWGSFDLGVKRFSGRKAPLFTPSGAVPNMPAAVEIDAYSDAVSSAGFWLGGQGVDYAAFYSYASPAPDGFSMTSVPPADAFWNKGLNQFNLPYDAVRSADNPDQALAEFLVIGGRTRTRTLDHSTSGSFIRRLLAPTLSAQKFFAENFFGAFATSPRSHDHCPGRYRRGATPPPPPF